MLETYPRDELFQTDGRRAATTSRRRCCTCRSGARPGCSCARTTYGRFMSCLVYLPRDRYTTAVRLRMEEHPARARSTATASTTRRGCPSRCWPGCTSSSACRTGSRSPTSTRPTLERRLVDATRTWDEDLAEALRAASTARRPARRLVGLYGKAFPEAYKEDFTARVGGRRPAPHRGARRTRTPIAAEPLPGAGRRAGRAPVQALPPRPALADRRCCRCSPTSGVEVVDERPYEIGRSDGAGVLRLRLRPAAPTPAIWARPRPRRRARAVPGRVRRGLGRATPRATASTPWSSAPG